jgi:hypothetical protein
MRIGSKKIYHLEAWVVKVMSLYKVCPLSPWSFWSANHGPSSTSFTTSICLILIEQYIVLTLEGLVSRVTVVTNW